VYLFQLSVDTDFLRFKLIISLIGVSSHFLVELNKGNSEEDFIIIVNRKRSKLELLRLFLSYRNLFTPIVIFIVVFVIPVIRTKGDHKLCVFMLWGGARLSPLCTPATSG
jgi:hypothetical protein